MLLTSQKISSDELIPGALPPSLKDPKEIIDLQLSSLEHLIATTERTLDQLTLLKKEIATYKKIQEIYLDNIEDKKILYNMLKSADSLLKIITKNQMAALFHAEFIAELNLLSQLFKKTGLQ